MDGVVYHDGWRGQWAAARVQCNICTNKWVAVFPACVDETELQCPSCEACDSTVCEKEADD